jgi:hypothetical protein
MKKVPDSLRVAQALKAADKAIHVSLRKLNRQAGQLMARGDYSGAETLAATGRELQSFRAEFDALRKRWNGIRAGAKTDHVKNATTPLWAYYQPILQALAELGGEARRSDIEPHVERLMKEKFQPGDNDPVARGRLRWQAMIRRAHRHLLKEGWLEARSGGLADHLGRTSGGKG